MPEYVTVGKIKVAKIIYDFFSEKVVPEAELDVGKFWQDFEQIVLDFTPRNRELLETREKLQEQIDQWHKENKDFDSDKYKALLEEIGYLEEEVEDFEITTTNVDDEIANIAGPQLVVPINNARYAINAANARWGSLYDAFYGTDIISEDDGAEKSGSYNLVRGNKVIAKSKDFLDRVVPLILGSHHDVTKYAVENGQLMVTLRNNSSAYLKNKEQFVGYKGEESNPSSILLKNNGLHIDIEIDANDPIGKTDNASVKDIVLESTIRTIDRK